MRYAFAVLLALALSACGGDPYQAPPASNGYKPGTTPQGNTGPRKKEPTGPSFTREYNAEAAKAQTAWSAFAKDKSSDNYALCGAHIYKALSYRIQHERNGHDPETLRELRELNLLKKDWTATEGQLTTEEKTAYKAHADYKTAFEEYQKLQQETE